MQAAIAIVLLLNGVQVDLPAPAQVIDQIACVPARAVCERVGASVHWQAPERRLIIKSRNAEHAFPLAESFPDDSGLWAVQADGVTYVPGRALAACLGGSCRWSAATRTLDLRLPWSAQEPLEAPVGALRDQSLQWLNGLVTVRGRVARAAALSGEDAQSDPSGWLLQADGCLSCDSQEFKAVAPSPPPFSALGRSVIVVGHVGLDDAGTPFLKPISVAAVPETTVGAAWLSADRFEVDRHGSLVLTVGAVIGGGADVGDTRQFVLELRSPEGETQQVAVPAAAMAVVEGTGGQWVELSGHLVWRLPPVEGRRGVGVWQARLLLPKVASPPGCCFRVIWGPIGSVISR